MEVLILDAQILLELFSHQNKCNILEKIDENLEKTADEQGKVNHLELMTNSSELGYIKAQNVLNSNQEDKYHEEYKNYWRSAYTKDDEINACSQKSVISQILFDIDFNELGFSVILISTENSYKSNIEIFKKLHILNQFKDCVIYDEALSTEFLEGIVCRYERNSINRYEIVLLSASINNLSIANQCNLRTAFYSEFAKPEEYEMMENYKPEFDSKEEIVSKRIYQGEVICSNLPSQNMINVGVKMAYSKRSISCMLNHGFFFNSDKVKYKTICLEAPLKHQGPLDIVICKLVDYLDEDQSSKNFRKVLELEQFCEENKIHQFDSHFPIIECKYRNLFYNKVSEFLDSEEYSELSMFFQESMIKPKTTFIRSSENKDLNHLLCKMDEENIQYPLIIKLNKCYGTEFSHAKYLINSIDGITKMLDNKEFLKEDIIIEELIPHSEELQIKIYCLSNRCMFWRNPFIIQTDMYQKTTMFSVINNVDGESRCFNVIEDVNNETRFNVRFLQKITEKLLKRYSATFLAFDFIVSSIDNSYVLIDVNYFPPFGKLNSSLLSKYLNEFCEASVKISEKDKHYF